VLKPGPRADQIYWLSENHDLSTVEKPVETFLSKIRGVY